MQERWKPGVYYGIVYIKGDLEELPKCGIHPYAVTLNISRVPLREVGTGEIQISD